VEEGVSAQRPRPGGGLPARYNPSILIRRILLLAALAIGACSRNGPALSGVRMTEQELTADPTHALDLLFVIITSVSTMEEKLTLGRAFPTLLAELATLPDGPPDLHVGVISSDLGAGSLVMGACKPGGDRGVLQAHAACGLAPQDRFLVSSDGGRQTNFGGDLATAFACLARLGDTGCAFEHHLQAARLALDEAATPENRGFLRPEAHLGIVFLSDDDDCSAPPETQLFEGWGHQPMEFSGTFCARAGHMCGGAPLPATGPFTAPLGQCQPSETGGLIPVPELVTAIRRVKSRPDQLTVAGIFGWPPDAAATSYEIRMYGAGTNLAPICSSPQGEASVGLRFNTFVEAFGDAGVRDTVCQAEYTATARAIGQRLVARMSLACLGTRPADLEASTAGLQPRCEVVERIPRAGGHDEAVLAQCSPGSPRPCWTVVEDPRCASSGVRAVVDRAGTKTVPGTTQLFRCATCLDPGDPRCRR
jgi:hypothetical protein